MNKEPFFWVIVVVVAGYLAGLHPGLIALLAGATWAATYKRKERG